LRYPHAPVFRVLLQRQASFAKADDAFQKAEGKGKASTGKGKKLMEKLTMTEKRALDARNEYVIASSARLFFGPAYP
jgi:hypothetical protein